jgi:hypothetical protein
LLAVALIVVPDTETVAPLPLGQAAGTGRVISCALLQLSLAGCEKITVVNIKKQNKIPNVFNAVRLSLN